MPKAKKYYLASILLVAVFILSGCITVNSGKKNPGLVDGGLFKSIDKGLTWAQKTAIPSVTGQPRNFSGINIASFAIDPSDNKALYYGSVDNGMFYSYDAGESWQIATGLGKFTVRAVAIDPAYKCNVYAAVGNRVMKTSDCSRTWAQAYYDNDLMVTVDAIAIDYANSADLYIGVSRGDIIKSYNRGDEWQTIYRASDKIKKIIIDPNNSNTVYVLAERKGLMVSTDAGKNFTEVAALKAAFTQYKMGADIKDVILLKDNPGYMFVATSNGMLRSKDSGNTWEKIELIPDVNKAAINTMAVSDKDPNEIYYVTNTTFYRSADGGSTWKTIKLPTTRAGWKLAIDPVDPNLIYMGVIGK